MKKSLLSLLLLAFIMVGANAQKPTQKLQKEDAVEAQKDNMKTNSPEQQAEKQTERLTKVLNLAPEQVKPVYKFCLDAAFQLQKLKASKVNKPAEKKAAMHKINMERDEAIRGVLSPEQVEKFDQVMMYSSDKGVESKATRKVDFLHKTVKLSDEQKKIALKTYTKYETLRAKMIKEKPSDGSSMGAAIQKLRESERQEIRTILTKEQIAIFDKTKGADRPRPNGPKVDRPDRSKGNTTVPVKPEKPNTPVKPEKPNTPVKPEKPNNAKATPKVKAEQFTQVLTEKLDLTDLQLLKIQTLNNNAAEEIQTIKNGRANKTTKKEMIQKIIDDRDAAIADILNRKQKKAFETIKSDMDALKQRDNSNIRNERNVPADKGTGRR